MAGNDAIQFCRVDTNKKFDELYNNSYSIYGTDGQPVYVKDTNRLYIGNNKFDHDGDTALMPLVAPYRHTIRFKFKGSTESNISSSGAIQPTKKIDALITCVSFRKEPIMLGSNSFHSMWRSLWNEEKLDKKLFPVSATGFANSAYASKSMGANTWKAHEIAGPIVGWVMESVSGFNYLGLLFSYMFTYEYNKDNSDPYKYTSYTLANPLLLRASSSSGPDQREYGWEQINGEPGSDINFGDIMAVRFSSDHLEADSISLLDTVTDNY